jgi:hypothetical protein
MLADRWSFLKSLGIKKERKRNAERDIRVNKIKRKAK